MNNKKRPIERITHYGNVLKERESKINNGYPIRSWYGTQLKYKDKDTLVMLSSTLLSDVSDSIVYVHKCENIHLNNSPMFLALFFLA